jgi:putative DNA methylase
VMTALKKKLIEVSLPLEAINAAGAREKSIRQGHPSTLHLYWARRPLAAARAVLFAQLVDDPSSRPDEFETIEAQDAERARLHGLIEKLVVWETSNNEELLREARAEIRKSNGGELPAVLDPFAGGGAIPLEAQRLGLEAHASDLNPLAVLLNKALIEFPPRFSGNSPVFPGAAQERQGWTHAEGLAADVRRYGEWMRDEAEQRIGHLYPKVKVSGGTEHTVIAWFWARTVFCQNPACQAEVPLLSSLALSSKRGQEISLNPVIVGKTVTFKVMDGPPTARPNKTGQGAKFTCWVCGSALTPNEVHKQLDVVHKPAPRLLAAVASVGNRGRTYTDVDSAHQEAAREADAAGANIRLDPGELGAETRGTFGGNAQGRRYGFFTFADYFTNRQLVNLTTMSDLVGEARLRVLKDALTVGMPTGERLESGGVGAEAYADAVATYLALAVSKSTNIGSSLASWMNDRGAFRETFARQAIPMVWDYVEINPLGDFGGTFMAGLEKGCRAIEHLPGGVGEAHAADAATQDYSSRIISTDPPYYDNISYSDLSDYFYVWLRRTLRDIHPNVVTTMLTPKAEELVANSYRHGGEAGAEKFFVNGFNAVFRRIRLSANMDAPLTVYYAYKQQDSDSDGVSSTGWHTLLNGLIDSGWEITATWPMRTEGSGRLVAKGTNALASSIVLACRPRLESAESTTRRAFAAALKSELPEALRTLMQGAIAPVDLAQAAIGPGISVFSRYSRVREADGSDMSVKDALLLINATLDEVLGEQESDFDPNTRFAVKWYRQYGWDPENSGIAEQLARSSDTSRAALERGGFFEAKGGKARLLSPSQLDGAWDPEADDEVSVWEATVRLAAAMSKDGADRVAVLLAGMQTKVNLDAVRELGFLLFHEAEKKSDTKDAILFNSLVSAWGDVNEQARKFASAPRPMQQAFDLEDGD